jgi:NAD(P)H dehydrogenase (quinone)
MGEVILIGGATGRTGKAAVETALNLGKRVRALVHADDERARALQDRGAEIAVGDYENIDTLRSALEGVGAAYFNYPIKPGLIEATTNFAQAAREARVSAIVNMSQISAARHSKSHAAQNHWLSERIFDWAARPVQDHDASDGGAAGSTMATTHLRPTFFADWLTSPIWKQGIVNEKKIEFPFGDIRHAPVAAEDQGRLIGHILANPAPHAGKTYPLFGAAQVHFSEVASILSDVFDIRFSYAPLSIEDFQRRLEQLKASPFMVQHMVEVTRNYHDGVFSGMNSVIEDVTGKPPMTIREFVEKNRRFFEAAA